MTWRERAHLIDAVTGRMHAMGRIPGSDQGEMPELQALLVKLMGPGQLLVAGAPEDV